MLVLGSYLAVIDFIGLTEPLPCSPQNLAQLSVGLPAENGFIVATPGKKALVIRGLTSSSYPTSLCFEALRPGAMFVRQDFNLIAAIEPHGGFSIIHEDSRPEDAWHFFIFLETALRTLYADEFIRWKLSWLLSVLGQSMRQHGRGGRILFTKATDQKELPSLQIKYPVTQGVLQGADYLARRVANLQEFARRHGKRELRKQKRRGIRELIITPDSKEERTVIKALRFIGGLTAVDGAVVLGEGLRLLGYGAKIDAAQAAPTHIVECTVTTSRTIRLKDTGNMRHQLAARFVYQNRESGALVVSQDGPVCVFTWDAASDNLLAVRAELLVATETQR